MDAMEITPVSASAEVKALLSTSDLPIDDLDDPSIALYGAFEGGRLLGVVGLQVLAGAGLLRSLAVDSSVRDRGLGARLCERVLREAQERELVELWLLTTSARDYFARRGFEAVPRDQAPSAVRATAQFTSLCPATAVVMRRSLAAYSRA
jgi:amino-acid N-acetyltransferase